MNSKRLYCKRCVFPSTKPYLTFDDQGICSACRFAEQKSNIINGINWSEREKEFNELVVWAKSQKAPLFDALVPVSGGKDSITQVHRLLGKDLRILAVNIDYGIKTDLGIQNLNVIPNMGASLITFRPELGLQKRLIRIGFEDFGDPDLMSHALLHAYPLRTALQLKIPLVLLGENSALEYSGESKAMDPKRMARAWFQRYALNKEQGVELVSKRYGIAPEKLVMYDYPDAIDGNSSIQPVFLSYFYKWDSNTHFSIAREYGFKALATIPDGTYRNFVGVDELINRWHQYMKVLKFGYGRATDHACEDIRNGMLTRAEAKELVRKHDLLPMGREIISQISQFLNYEEGELEEKMERFRNREIWSGSPGNWNIPSYLED